MYFDCRRRSIAWWENADEQRSITDRLGASGSHVFKVGLVLLWYRFEVLNTAFRRTNAHDSWCTKTDSSRFLGNRDACISARRRKRSLVCARKTVGEYLPRDWDLCSTRSSLRMRDDIDRSDRWIGRVVLALVALHSSLWMLLSDDQGYWSNTDIDPI